MTATSPAPLPADPDPHHLGWSGEFPPLPRALDAVVGGLAAVSSVWSPSLSPDGARVAFVSDRDGLPRLVVADLAPASAEEAAGTVVSPEGQEVVSVAWSPDGDGGQWLAYLVSPAGSIRSRLHAVRPDGSQHRVLAGLGNDETVFAGCWTATPGRYAYSVARGEGAELRAVDVESGVVTPLASGGFLALTATSWDGMWALARQGVRGRRHLVLVDVASGEQRRLLPRDLPDGVPVDGEDGRFDATGRVAYLRTSLGGEYTVLAAVPLSPDGAPGDPAVLAARPGVDLDSYAVRGDGRTAVCIWNRAGRSAVEVVALGSAPPPALGGDGGHVGETLHEVTLPADSVVTAWSLTGDGAGLLACLTRPRLPRTLWWCPLPTDTSAADRTLAAPVPLAASEPGPEQVRVLARAVAPRRVELPAADGLVLDGWLYTPDGRLGPGPAVVTFHGGPESQERPAYSPVAQSLVAAGLTVFAPNVRGSSGYGRSFVSADEGERRLTAIDDVRAVVDALVAAGVADPARLGAHGWSYGGFLTLAAVARWPEMFTAACSVAGMSDLRTFFATTEAWMAAASVVKYGDPATQADLLRELSPLTHVDRIRTPSLLVHGDRDTNVPVGESVQLHRALQARGVPTALMLLAGEGHTVVGRTSRLHLAEGVAGWFTRWLTR